MTSVTKIIVIFALALLLNACASKPITLTHYLLHDPNNSASAEHFALLSANAGKTIVKVDSVSFPEYLKQRRLVTMTAPNTLFYATQHLWGEPFANSFMTALKDAGSQQGLLIVARADNIEINQGYTAQIAIIDFITNHQGQVVLRGNVSITPVNSEALSNRDQQAQHFVFKLQQPLSQDGFAASVATMGELVTQFVEQLASHLQQ